jgi:hypothetical protein
MVALAPMLDALGIKERVTFEESQALLLEFGEKTGSRFWPELSGNDVCAFANLVISRKVPK